MIDFSFIDPGTTTAGFSVESFVAAGGSAVPAGSITGGGDIAKEFGVESIRLDLDGIDLDIDIDNGSGLGNPYFDNVFQGRRGGLGNCRDLTATAQCNPSSDDNVTMASGEALLFSFETDAGAATKALFGDFIFRENDHYLFNGSVAVLADGGLTVISVTNGVGDLSVLGATSALEFLSDSGTTDNYYIDMANINVVPVPAAVWLFGSALGLLGWMRRRA